MRNTARRVFGKQVGRQWIATNDNDDETEKIQNILRRWQRREQKKKLFVNTRQRPRASWWTRWTDGRTDDHGHGNVWTHRRTRQTDRPPAYVRDWQTHCVRILWLRLRWRSRWRRRHRRRRRCRRRWRMASGHPYRPPSIVRHSIHHRRCYHHSGGGSSHTVDAAANFTDGPRRWTTPEHSPSASLERRVSKYHGDSVTTPMIRWFKSWFKETSRPPSVVPIKKIIFDLWYEGMILGWNSSSFYIYVV